MTSSRPLKQGVSLLWKLSVFGSYYHAFKDIEARPICGTRSMFGIGKGRFAEFVKTPTGWVCKQCSKKAEALRAPPIPKGTGIRAGDLL